MKINHLKSVVTLIASVGVGAVVTNAVKATTPPDLKVLNKLAVLVGTMAASHTVADAASSYFGNTIDEWAEAINKVKDELNSDQEPVDD